MRKLYIALFAALCLYGASRAIADVNYTQGAGTVIFDFVCFTTKHCTAHVPINSAGTEILTAAAPGQVTGANGTFPVTGTVTANQGTAAAATAGWPVNPGLVTSAGTGWTSGTAGNTTQALMSSGGWPALLVQLNQTSTISGGAVTFEGTYDGTNWVSIPIAQLLNPNTLASLTNPYTLVQSTNQPFLILTQGYQQVRLKLSTVITGSATVTPQIALLPYNPTISGILNPTAISQTTDGTTNGVRLTSQYPAGATPITASATGTTAATTATLAASASLKTYVCSLSIRANATAAATGNATVTGTVTGTLNFTQWTAPNASGLGVTEQIYNPCVPSSATNTAIAVISAAPGTGGVVSVTATGYQAP